MASKRPHEDARDSHKSAKKQKKGFSVGPANLPDGTYKRKVQKIKKDLIHKAKLKQQYAKLKARGESEPAAPRKSVYDREAEAGEGDSEGSDEPAPEPNLEPHPDRVKMFEGTSPEPSHDRPTERRQRRPRPQPFKNESELARKNKKQAEARRKAREEADRERATKLAERERFRRTMAKARPGPNGKRKLGRESTVLLTKAQRVMGKT